jgi:hypothetical protein
MGSSSKKGREMTDDLNEILEQLTEEERAEMDAQVAKETKPSAKKKKKGKKKKAKAKEVGRGPEAPKSTEHEKRKALEEILESQDDENLGGEIYAAQPVEVTTPNPRYSNSDGARASQRREKIWKRRQAEGRGAIRRNITGPDGEDTGATTSSLE